MDRETKFYGREGMSLKVGKTGNSKEAKLLLLYYQLCVKQLLN